MPVPSISTPRCRIAKKNATRKNGRYPGAAREMGASSPLPYRLDFIGMAVPARPNLCPPGRSRDQREVDQKGDRWGEQNFHRSPPNRLSNHAAAAGGCHEANATARHRATMTEAPTEPSEPYQKGDGFYLRALRRKVSRYIAVDQGRIIRQRKHAVQRGEDHQQHHPGFCVSNRPRRSATWT